MHAAAAIFKFAAGLRDHRKVEHELHPVLALHHFFQGDFAVIEVAVKARGHAEKVLNGYAVLAVVVVVDFAIRKAKAQAGARC